MWLSVKRSLRIRTIWKWLFKDSILFPVVGLGGFESATISTMIADGVIIIFIISSLSSLLLSSSSPSHRGHRFVITLLCIIQLVTSNLVRNKQDIFENLSISNTIVAKPLLSRWDWWLASASQTHLIKIHHPEKQLYLLRVLPCAVWEILTGIQSCKHSY